MLELNKAARRDATMPHLTPEQRWAVKSWLDYFRLDWQAVKQSAYLPVLNAMQQLEHLSSDKETRRLAEEREIHAYMQWMERKKSFEDGLAEGKIEGKAEGSHEKSLEVAHRALARGMLPEDVADLTGLPLAEIVKLH